MDLFEFKINDFIAIVDGSNHNFWRGLIMIMELIRLINTKNGNLLVKRGIVNYNLDFKSNQFVKLTFKEKIFGGDADLIKIYTNGSIKISNFRLFINLVIYLSFRILTVSGW